MSSAAPKSEWCEENRKARHRDSEQGTALRTAPPASNMKRRSDELVVGVGENDRKSEQ
jgi:hypothetical protein